MSCKTVSCWMSLCLVVAIASAEESGFKIKPGLSSSEIQVARSISEDGHAETLLFNNLSAQTEIGQGQLPSVSTRQFSFGLQIESQKEVCVTQDIRGFLSANGSGSAALLIQSGGKSTLVDLKKATEQASGEIAKTVTSTRKAAMKAGHDLGFGGKKTPAGAHDFYYRIESRVPAGKPLQVTVILLVDRLPGDDNSGCLIVVDSLDLEVHPLPAK